MVAEFLEQHPRVAWVAYPGLASHEQHELAERLYPGGPGAMLAFAVEGGKDEQNAFVARLRIIVSAVSLGHDETLIAHTSAGSGPRAEQWPERFAAGHLRLSVGLEDADDLVADLRQALDAY